MTEARKSRVDSSEIVGFVAITLASIGAIVQLVRAHKTKDMSSFSPYYLLCCGLGELLFAVQGGMKRSITLTLTRVMGVLYFGYFSVLWFMHRDNDPTIACKPEPCKKDTQTNRTNVPTEILTPCVCVPPMGVSLIAGSTL